MQTNTKKRVEVVSEAPMARSLARLLDNHGRGYTMLPVLGGSGRSGPWAREGQVSSAGGMVAARRRRLAPARGTAVRGGSGVSDLPRRSTAEPRR